MTHITYKDRTDNCAMIIREYAKDTRVSFKGLCPIRSYWGPAHSEKKRSVIRAFTVNSAKRLKFFLRNSAALWKAMITLTYPGEFPGDGKTVKEHINVWCQFLRRLNIKYFWILEFQTRGAPHFHFLTSEQIDKDIVSRRWFEIVGSKDDRHLKAGTRCDIVRDEKHLFTYMTGYFKKLIQKKVPARFENVGRWWGCTRDILKFKIQGFYGNFKEMSAKTRILRRWYKSSLRQYKIKWKWKGEGFNLTDGSAFFNTAFKHIDLDVYKLAPEELEKLLAKKKNEYKKLPEPEKLFESRSSGGFDTEQLTLWNLSWQ